MRKIIVITGIVILIAAAAFWGYKKIPRHAKRPSIQTFSTNQNPAFKAVPQKCPLIIEVKNTLGFYNVLKGDNPLIAELRGIKAVNGLVSDVNEFFDFVSSRSDINDLLEGKSIIFSVNPSGKNQLTSLFLVQMNDADESNSATKTISSDLGSQYTISHKNYDNISVFNAHSDERNFYFACANDILMLSEDDLLLEQAIRQSNSENLLSNHEFKELYKTIEENSVANIFINHLTIHQLLAKYVASDIRKKISDIDTYSTWSDLDLSVEKSALQLSGYSVTKDSTDNYLNVFNNQEVQSMDIEKAIPANASGFVAMNLQNTSEYLDHFESYLKINGTYYPREMSMVELHKKTKIDAVKLFKEVWSGQVAGVYTTINKSNPEQNRFLVAEVLKEKDVQEKITKAANDFRSTNRGVLDNLHTEFAVNGRNTFDIYRLPFNNMAESLFGRAFAGIKCNYLVLYRSYLIWGDNLPGLKTYLQSLVTDKTMANDSIFKGYAKNRQPNANFYLYAKVPKLLGLKDVFLNPELSADLAANEEIIRKFSVCTWQFAFSNNMVKHKISLYYNPNVKEEPQALWQLKLDAALASQPKMVLNHKDMANQEVIVTDKQNNVYLISKEGAILWKINLPGEVISDIHQVDLYQNKKFQYLFNTKTQLFVIDRMGKNVGKFPVNFSAMASNGVSVAEYGKNKEFRFFVAGTNRKIYAYDRDGKLIPKWSFEGSQNPITKPICHYDIAGKDYIVCSDGKNTYLLDRQGKSRDIQIASYKHSDNQTYFFGGENPRLIGTDTSGKIHIQEFSGQEEVKEFGKFGSNHQFLAADIDGNGSPEYLFAEGKKLTVFAANGKKMFERSFRTAISETPFVCNLGSGIIKIGVVLGGENKIYLLDKTGSVMNGFPLPGNTSFVMGKFNKTVNYFNLLVGNEDGSLLNYKIE